jgi:hypothetical protein
MSAISITPEVQVLLDARIMSWFTNETICMECSKKEREIKTALRAKGIAGAMEGCGYVPDPEKL